jgi:GNAT superfamily N-acetyltransferase
MGTRRLYDLLDDDPRFRLEPVDQVCDPAVIAGHDRMVSVTQAFAVDLSGQVCTEQLDGSLYGGVSTGPDFHRGALASGHGTPVICLASRTPLGDPAIRPTLGPDDPVSIERADVRWVVTEYAIAYLFGLSLAERAVALMEIAHPDDRELLLRAAKQQGIVARLQALRSRVAYPVTEEREMELRDGRWVLVRPTRTSDRGAMQDLFHRLTEENVYTRFFQKLSSLTDTAADHLCNVDYSNEMAFAAVVGPPEREQIVAASCYYRDPATALGEVAYMVDPAWQRLGLAMLLHTRTQTYAATHGVRGFTADVLPTNHAMLRVFERGNHLTRVENRGGVLDVQMEFRSGPGEVDSDRPLGRLAALPRRCGRGDRRAGPQRVSRNYEAGETVCVAGQPGTSLFLVERGLLHGVAAGRQPAAGPPAARRRPGRGGVADRRAAVGDRAGPGAPRCRRAAFTPLAVLPQCERRGISAALVRAALNEADRGGEPLVVLESSPSYYGRLGFKFGPGVPNHNRPARHWAPHEAAQVYLLSSYHPTITGRVEYPPAIAAASR